MVKGSINSPLKKNVANSNKVQHDFHQDMGVATVAPFQVVSLPLKHNIGGGRIFFVNLNARKFSHFDGMAF